jgi:endonuclease/exonuclease/phosphatase family metal-dependent hydrolase
MKLKPKKRNIIFSGFALAVSSLTFLSSLAPYISPQTFWIIAILGLGFYYLYIINFIFLAWCIVRIKKTFFISLVPFLTGLPVLLHIIAFNFSSPQKTSEKNNSIKVITYNVHIFDLYNWRHNAESRLKFFDFFTKENPDILCMQEFYTSTNAGYRNLDTLKQFLHCKNVHALLPIFIYGTDYFGIATLSRFPILKKEIIFSDPKSANGGISSDVLIGNDTVRIYNLHMQSIRFKNEDYKYVKNISAAHEDKPVQGLLGIVKRLHKAFIKRAKQADLVAESIRQCPYPVIVCGDFNDSPSSNTYHTISNSLSDSFLENSRGAGSTYNGIFPAFRIDYILHSNKISSSNYKKHHFTLSDHFPIATELELKQENKSE